MKTWIKRSLIGLAIATTLVGGLAVAHGPATAGTTSATPTSRR
jgi:hypothetical protein